MIKSFFEKNKFEYAENISLKKYNTYKIDSHANYIVFPKNIEELKKIMKFIKINEINYYILGNGSNVIFSKNEYKGIIIKLDKFNKIEYDNDYVTAEAGVPLIKLAYDTINNGLSGLEFATGIPGQFGASCAMNAGAYKSSLSDFIEEITYLDNDDNEIKTIKKEEANYSYRDSKFKNNPNNIIISAKLKLDKGNIEEMLNRVNERKEKRIATQPLDYPNAGSVFRNPENMFAGELIEKANLKGFHINDAEVSLKHANFIINKGNATGQDIITLIEKIQEDVLDKYNVKLKLEQIIIK